MSDLHIAIEELGCNHHSPEMARTLQEIEYDEYLRYQEYLDDPEGKVFVPASVSCEGRKPSGDCGIVKQLAQIVPVEIPDAPPLPN